MRFSVFAYIQMKTHSEPARPSVPYRLSVRLSVVVNHSIVLNQLWRNYFLQIAEILGNSLWTSWDTLQEQTKTLQRPLEPCTAYRDIVKKNVAKIYFKKKNFTLKTLPYFKKKKNFGRQKKRAQNFRTKFIHSGTRMLFHWVGLSLNGIISAPTEVRSRCRDEVQVAASQKETRRIWRKFFCGCDSIAVTKSQHLHP